MIQGTASHVGKSAVVAGLCRLLYRQGVRVAPFKPQNMALNSAVTVDGGEIGRAQAVQAYAAGLLPHSDMNPVLLKPNSDTTAQVIIQGQVRTDLNARQYHAYKPVAMQAVLESYHRLRTQYDVIIVEGAGSPAEINLRDRDIANMGFAEAVDCPVWLVGDIDRGGVFAQLVGTLALLSASEQARIRGFVINQFRGDVSLLTPGIDWLQQHTGKPVLGVLPYVPDLHLEAEDAVDTAQPVKPDPALHIVVLVWPRISNHTDLDPLRLHPHVDVQWVRRGALPSADLIILPGSKNVRADLDYLRAQGWDQALKRHLRYGGRVIGLCGGFQMLGSLIRDPLGLEGPAGDSPGLGLLEMTTTLEAHKQLHNVQGHLIIDGEQAAVTGYEIHLGISEGEALAHPLARLSDGRWEGARSADNHIIGTYLHGLFEHPNARASLLHWAGGEGIETAADYRQQREQALNQWADVLTACLDWSALGWV